MATQAGWLTTIGRAWDDAQAEPLRVDGAVELLFTSMLQEARGLTVIGGIAGLEHGRETRGATVGCGPTRAVRWRQRPVRPGCNGGSNVGTMSLSVVRCRPGRSATAGPSMKERAVMSSQPVDVLIFEDNQDQVARIANWLGLAPFQYASRESNRGGPPSRP